MLTIIQYITNTTAYLQIHINVDYMSKEYKASQMIKFLNKIITEFLTSSMQFLVC